MVFGKTVKDVCIGLLEKYHTEKKKLRSELDNVFVRLENENQDERDADEFIC